MIAPVMHNKIQLKGEKLVHNQASPDDNGGHEVTTEYEVSKVARGVRTYPARMPNSGAIFTDCVITAGRQQCVYL